MSEESSRSRSSQEEAALAIYLDVLFGAEPQGAFIEMRAIAWDRPARQEFFDVHDVGGLVEEAIRAHASEFDVYVGAAPRTRRVGGKDAVKVSHVLWADLDTPEAKAKFETFCPEPVTPAMPLIDLNSPTLPSLSSARVADPARILRAGHDHGRRHLLRVRQRDLELHPALAGRVGGAAVEPQRRRLTRDDLDVPQPEVAQAERLDRGLLGREPGCEVPSGAPARPRIGELVGGENAIGEPRMTLHRALQPAHVEKVDANAAAHRSRDSVLR
jgi:hypothetical protein